MSLAFYFLKAVGLKAVGCRTLAALPVSIGGQSILGANQYRAAAPWPCPRPSPEATLGETKLRALNAYSCMTYHIFAGKAWIESTKGALEGRGDALARVQFPSCFHTFRYRVRQLAIDTSRRLLRFDDHDGLTESIAAP